MPYRKEKLFVVEGVRVPPQVKSDYEFPFTVTLDRPLRVKEELRLELRAVSVSGGPTDVVIHPKHVKLEGKAGQGPRYMLKAKAKKKTMTQFAVLCSLPFEIDEELSGPVTFK